MLGLCPLAAFDSTAALPGAVSGHILLFTCVQ